MSFKLVEAKHNDENFISCKEFFNPIRSKKGITSPIKFDMCEPIMVFLSEDFILVVLIISYL